MIRVCARVPCATLNAIHLHQSHRRRQRNNHIFMSQPARRTIINQSNSNLLPFSWANRRKIISTQWFRLESRVYSVVFGFNVNAFLSLSRSPSHRCTTLNSIIMTLMPSSAASNRPHMAVITTDKPFLEQIFIIATTIQRSRSRKSIWPVDRPRGPKTISL